jgi:hypothetical protein
MGNRYHSYNDISYPEAAYAAVAAGYDSKAMYDFDALSSEKTTLNQFYPETM